MNNNYTYFNPNSSFMRAAPLNSGIMSTAPLNSGIMSTAAPLPRFSSLLGGSKLGSAAATTVGASKVTFSGILNGASKTLGVINQAIPVFYQVKPIWNNARTMFRVVKEINSKDKTTTNTNNNTYNNTNNTEKKEQGNAPTFFA